MGDLVEQFLGAVRHLQPGELDAAELPTQLADVRDEPVGDGGGAGLQPGHPQVLLEAVVAAPLHPRVALVVLASVDPRVDVAEGLRDGLDALPRCACSRVEHLRGGDVAALDRVGEPARSWSPGRRPGRPRSAGSPSPRR